MTARAARLPHLARPLGSTDASAWVDRLARTECPALTARRKRRAEATGASHDPIVWAEAYGSNVVDVDGNVYVDLTGSFGVAVLGHAAPEVTRAIAEQAARLPLALGDVYPSDAKIRLLEQLKGLAPFDDARVMLGLSGADAVEAAVQTALLATRRTGVLAFEGGYHGLSLGALATCGYKAAFRAPFAPQLNPYVGFAPFPDRSVPVSVAMAAVEAAWNASPAPVGLVLVEPVQARGGVRLPPEGFLGALRELAHARGALLAVDEIYTGLGRTGAWLSCAAQGVVPDVLCIGKALGGGMPLSACLAPAAIMGAWGEPGGEALRTSTFLGQPIACAASLATLSAIRDQGLDARAASEGAWLLGRLRAATQGIGRVRDVRGAGLLVGIELADEGGALRLVRALLERGYLTLPAGADARVLQLSPPLTIAREQLDGFAVALADALAADEAA